MAGMFNRVNLRQLAEQARQGISQTASSLRDISGPQRAGSPTRSRSVRTSQGVRHCSHPLWNEAGLQWAEALQRQC